MLFEVRKLTKRFQHRHALRNVSFRVEPGEILGIIGPNGAGKTTLFECLADMLPASGGEVLHGGRVVNGSQRSQLLFYVPDAIAPWPHETVQWALRFACGFLDGQAELLPELIEKLNLSALLSQRLGVLSKGQRKRVMLALGLLARQPALLIDEPFEGLDLRQGREIAGVLRAHAARGRALLLSIHQINEAERLCDRFVLLNNGELKGEGTVSELNVLARTLHPAQTFANLEEVFLGLT